MDADVIEVQEVLANEQAQLTERAVQELVRYCEQVTGMERVVGEVLNLGDTCVGPAGVDERAKRFSNLAVATVKGGEDLQLSKQLKVIGRMMKLVREERGISRELLSCLSGVSRDDIFCFEHGMLTLDEASRVAAQTGPFLLEDSDTQLQSDSTFQSVVPSCP